MSWIQTLSFWLGLQQSPAMAPTGDDVLGALGLRAGEELKAKTSGYFVTEKGAYGLLLNHSFPHLGDRQQQLVLLVMTGMVLRTQTSRVAEKLKKIHLEQQAVVATCARAKACRVTVQSGDRKLAVFIEGTVRVLQDKGSLSPVLHDEFSQSKFILVPIKSS